MIMANRRLSSVVLTLALIFAVPVSPKFSATPEPAPQTPTAAAPSPDLSARLAAIEKTIEEKRKELGVPGLAVVIVKDDQAIFQKGFGLRDVEHNQPVTPETLFAIGSCTKAFTAMSVMISADENKLSLDDSPRKY